MARPQVRFNLGQQRLAPRAQPVDTYAPPAVEMPPGAAGNAWLEAAEALAPLTQSVSTFLQGIEKQKREKAPQEAEQFIKGFDGDLSFLKDMPTMSREDAEAYLKENRDQFPTLKDEYAARPDFILYAQALAGSRYVREAQAIEGPNGQMLTVSEALNGRLEEAMQPGVDAAAIRREVREQFLESIGSPQSEAWNMALLDGLTPLENAWDQRVREGKAQNNAWQADQDQQSSIRSSLFDLVVHMSHPPSPTEVDGPQDEYPSEQGRLRDQNAQQRHSEVTKRLSDALKAVYEASGKVGVRKRNSNTLAGIEQMLREVQADDEDGLELAEAVEMLQEIEYADGQALGSSSVFREGISKIELELMREEDARTRARKEAGVSESHIRSKSVYDIVVPFLVDQQPKDVTEARQLAEEKRPEIEQALIDNGMIPELASGYLEEASTYYTRVYGEEDEPLTPEQRTVSRDIQDKIARGKWDLAEAAIRSNSDMLGARAQPLLEELSDAKADLKNEDYVATNTEILKTRLVTPDLEKMVRPGSKWQVDDLIREAEEEFFWRLSEVSPVDREREAHRIRDEVVRVFQAEAQELLESNSIANSPEELINDPEILKAIDSLATLQIGVRKEYDEATDRMVEMEPTPEQWIAINSRTRTLRAAAVEEARRLSTLDYGEISARERVQEIRTRVLDNLPVWTQGALAPKDTTKEPSVPSEAGTNQWKLEQPQPEPARFEGMGRSWLAPVTEALADTRRPGELGRQGVIDTLGTTTGYLRGSAPFFGPLSRGGGMPGTDWSNPEIREQLAKDPQFQEGFKAYQEFYPSTARTMRLFLSGIVSGYTPNTDSVSGDDGFDQIGLGLLPLTDQDTQTVRPYLSEAVAATGVSFAEVMANQIAEAPLALLGPSGLFPAEEIIAKRVHIGPFSPKDFDQAVAEFRDKEKREGSDYYKAFLRIGINPDAQMVGNDLNGNAWPGGYTQGDHLMNRIVSNYNTRYRSVLPESDLRALDIPIHQLGRMQVNEVPATNWRPSLGAAGLLNLEKVKDVPPGDLDPDVHGELIQFIVRNSKDFYGAEQSIDLNMSDSALQRLRMQQMKEARDD